MRKEIAGFEGKYDITSDGDVISLNYSGTGKEKILKARADNKGYLRVVLHKNNKPYEHKIHRLVAEAFIPKIEDKNYINHINGDKADNRIENLEWVTLSENTKHAFDTGLKSHKGEKHPQSKLKEQDIYEIFNLYYKGYKRKQIAPIFNVSHYTITDVLNRKSWKHIEIKKPS